MRALVTVSPTLGRASAATTASTSGACAWSRTASTPSGFARVTADEIAAFRARHGVPPGAVLVGSVGPPRRAEGLPDPAARVRARGGAASRRCSCCWWATGRCARARGAGAASWASPTACASRGHWTRSPWRCAPLDIFVLASKFEPYGVALLEAKAAGAAIVATRVNEIPEILGEDGAPRRWRRGFSSRRRIPRPWRTPSPAGRRTRLRAGRWAAAPPGTPRDRHSLRRHLHVPGALRRAAGRPRGNCRQPR